MAYGAPSWSAQCQFIKGIQLVEVFQATTKIERYQQLHGYNFHRIDHLWREPDCLITPHRPSTWLDPFIYTSVNILSFNVYLFI